MANVFLGRQPIYDRQQQVFAYELLFRSDMANSARIDDPDLATSQLIVNALTEFGLSNVVGSQLAFINLTESFICGKLPLPEQNQQLVLEILETVPINDNTLDGIRRLKQQGYRIALDDFIYHPHLQPLVSIADIVKIDVMALDRQTVQQHVQTLRRYPVKLLAEKVETQDDYQFYFDLGFDYFQGYYFCKPKIIQGHRTPANRLALLNLLAKLYNPETGLPELEQLIAQDVTLSYRLLRYINSSHYVLERKIDSIKNAVMLLGLNTVRNLITLIVMTSINDKPFELFVTALIRAHMCEQIGMLQQKKLQQAYFTVGLFSVIDAIMDQPMHAILAKLPLAENIAQALLDRSGAMGQTLQSVIAYERGEWDEVNVPVCDSEQIRAIYLHALNWCRDFTASLEQRHAA